MDRDPTNQTPDGFPPEPSSRPAGEELSTPTPDDAVVTPPVSVAVPPPDGVISLPAGHDLFVPPPPPPPTPSTLGRPPIAPPPAFPAEASPLPRKRGWRVVAGVVTVVALIAGGFAAGTLVSLDDDASAPEVTQPVVMPAAGNDLAPLRTLPDVPGPLGASPDSDEPVADVARVVAPSVVLIEADLGQGSGIVWDAEVGYIVTNNHVVADSQEVRVTFADGATTIGQVVGGDSRRDVAVIKVDPTNLHLVEAVFAPDDTVEVGQLAVAIGSPFGLDQTVTAGIVSAINRVNFSAGSDVENQGPVGMIQTDAPINPGNSGGPLADRQGRVVGMNTAIRTDGRTEGNIGVGFAVPSGTVDLIAQRIVAGESLEFGFLGISGESPTDGTQGALIIEVVANSPADVSGLEIGDLIISVGNESIATMEELAAQIQLYRPDDAVVVEVVRGAAVVSFEVVLGSR